MASNGLNKNKNGEKFTSLIYTQISQLRTPTTSSQTLINNKKLLILNHQYIKLNLKEKRSYY